MPEIRVSSISEIADGASLRVDVDGIRVVVVHIGDQWYALGDRCSHAEASLSEGQIDSEACAIECPKHGAMFSLISGEPASLPATRQVPTYGVRVDGDDVLVVIP
ncbi:MAG: non-heme iron oxygenase ferredoxin subunit [Acidimicrobiia bacterium]|nr:non-heme iron oxygenase ferredoxin subunit [Acidimicrobiia bacterium]